MRQRALIAMALACSPKLLIADEPTTALDVTIQAQILELLKELRRDLGLAIILITHNMGVAADLADRVLVMYAGRAVETGTSSRIFGAPYHPYTDALLRSAEIAGLDQKSPLVAIPGVPPPIDARPTGCRSTPLRSCPGRLFGGAPGSPRLPGGARGLPSPDPRTPGPRPPSRDGRCLSHCSRCRA
jgi:oligopeptide/dipeptide ABC transporter ATP-binding protein